jgi:hypothetical protein
MKFKNAVLLILGVGLMPFMVNSSLAGQDEFNAGFEEGYKSIKGDLVIVPIPPIAPITPIGSTDFREGIKAGMRAAGQ